MSSPNIPRVKVSIVGSLRDREVAYSTSDRQGSNFESCVWRTVSSQSSHHPQEVLLAQFSLYVHKGGLKPDSFHFQSQHYAFICIFQAHIPVESVVQAQCRTHGYTVPRGLMLKALQMFEALSDRQYAFTCNLCGHHPPIIITDLQRKACFTLKGIL